MTENFKTLLKCVSISLSKECNLKVHSPDFTNILFESAAQTVFPLVYSALSGKYDLSDYQGKYYGIIGNNIKIVHEHKILHELLVKNNIGYVFLKGCASARYYPDPLLRTMGDVDFLVKEADIEKTVNLLHDNGYITVGEFDGIHISFKNPVSNVHIELHRQINGIPTGQMSEKVLNLFSKIYEKSVLENGEYFCPSDFHHGLILLLHTASHLTSEGIGLRHLCDWAVFVSKFSDKEFLNLYEKPLKEIGLWKFAQILTQCAIRHLGCSAKNWVDDCYNDIADQVVEDIFSAGNFGKKDFSRYQQIKYIASRQDNTVDNTNTFTTLLSNALQKAKNEIPFVKKFPLLLPLGLAVVTLKYFWLIITKKRKYDTKNIIMNANSRKDLYSNFDLFKP